MSHDHFTLDMTPGNAPITICGHNTNDENSSYGVDVAIEKHAAVRFTYYDSTVVDEDSFPFTAGHTPNGVAQLKAAHLGPAITSIDMPSGTDSQGQVAVFGLVTMLCSGTITAGDWLVCAGTVGYGYMRAASQWDLEHSASGRSVISYGVSSGGLKKVLCLQLPWRINYNT